MTTKVDLLRQHIRASSKLVSQTVTASETHQRLFVLLHLYTVLSLRDPDSLTPWKLTSPLVTLWVVSLDLVHYSHTQLFSLFGEKKPLRKQLTKKIGDRPVMKIYIIKKGTHCSIPSDKNHDETDSNTTPYCNVSGISSFQSISELI